LRADGGGVQLVRGLFRATESGLQVVVDIRRSDDFFKLCLMDEAGGLLACAAQNQVRLLARSFWANNRRR
jgi:hypothetical protein